MHDANMFLGCCPTGQGGLFDEETQAGVCFPGLLEAPLGGVVIPKAQIFWTIKSDQKRPPISPNGHVRQVKGSIPLQP
jgi:hypothetical protein